MVAYTENSAMKTKLIIMGAAGRDFHNFNIFYRNNNGYEVVCFTASQIPNIDNRIYPPELAGELYPNGIPIYPEKELSELIKKYDVDEVVMAYSDLPYHYVMNRSAIVNAAGADFKLLGPKSTMLKSSKPVIAVCAVRTGCGKSQTSRKVFQILGERYEVAVIRHPMPYGNLVMQECQRFASLEDLDKYDCTIEEREEYEQYIDMGGVVYAGVDYEKILRKAEKADVIIWDGGNNDFPFIKPDLLITVADPHRAGHELSYYPGEVNFRMADVIIINKVDTADEKNIEAVRENARKVNPKAIIIKASSPVIIKNPDLLDKRVLVIEDGPSTTHGGLKYGAGMIAAKKYGAIPIDPRKYAVGSLKDIIEKFDIEVLPAMGYNDKQIEELEKSLNNANCDAVVSGTPIHLEKILRVNKPIIRARYEMGEEAAQKLRKILNNFLKF